MMKGLTMNGVEMHKAISRGPMWPEHGGGAREHVMRWENSKKEFLMFWDQQFGMWVLF